MFKRIGIVLALVCAMAGLMTPPTAFSGERIRQFNQRQINERQVRHRQERRDHRRAERRSHDYDRTDKGRRHRWKIRDRNSYSGIVSVYHQRHVGTWSYVTLPGRLDVIESNRSAPGAKIIDVRKLAPNSACSMENGVCVIRP